MGKNALPRWLGGLAVASAVLTLTIFGFWWTGILGVMGAMVWLFLTGGWIAVRGHVKCQQSNCRVGSLSMKGDKFLLYISRRSPLLGGILAVCGSLPMGAMMWWSVVVPVLSVVVAAFAVARAGRFAGARNVLA